MSLNEKFQLFCVHFCESIACVNDVKSTSSQLRQRSSSEEDIKMPEIEQVTLHLSPIHISFGTKFEDGCRRRLSDDDDVHER